MLVMLVVIVVVVVCSRTRTAKSALKFLAPGNVGRASTQTVDQDQKTNSPTSSRGDRFIYQDGNVIQGGLDYCSFFHCSTALGHILLGLYTTSESANRLCRAANR
jgi:hypothetical protein